jgi:SagB-type dehydrogenase family enzyme
MHIRGLSGLMLMLLGAAACTGPEIDAAGTSATATVAAEEEAVEVLELPAPRPKGDISLEEALAARRSVREFTDEPLTMQDLSQLLWAAQGLTASWGGRTAPSAGALYPLEVYLVTPEGLYHYLPDGHRIEALAHDDRRPTLARAALGQEAVADAAAVVIITGVYARTSQKYGDRAERYVHLEAGHAAQNVLLQAVSLGLGAVPIGAFEDRAVQEALGLPPDHEPLYLIPVGHPAPVPPLDARIPTGHHRDLALPPRARRPQLRIALLPTCGSPERESAEISPERTRLDRPE